MTEKKRWIPTNWTTNQVISSWNTSFINPSTAIGKGHSSVTYIDVCKRIASCYRCGRGPSHAQYMNYESMEHVTCYTFWKRPRRGWWPIILPGTISFGFRCPHLVQFSLRWHHDRRRALLSQRWRRADRESNDERKSLFPLSELE